MKELLRKNEVWIFLVLLVVSNAVLVTFEVSGIMPRKRFMQFGLLLSVLFGLVYLLHRFEGVWDVLKPMLVWRCSPWLYAAMILWTPIVCLLVLLVKGLVTGEHLTMEALAPGIETISEPKLLVVVIISSFLGEMVWISYTLRKLSQRYTHYVAALIVGFAWTLWWLPMAIFEHGIIPDLPLVALLINQSGIAAMCALVYFHTRSGVLVLVMQIFFNTTILVLPVTPSVNGVVTYWAFAIVYFTLSTLLFLKLGPTPMFRRPADGDDYDHKVLCAK